MLKKLTFEKNDGTTILRYEILRWGDYVRHNISTVRLKYDVSSRTVVLSNQVNGRNARRASV